MKISVLNIHDAAKYIPKGNAVIIRIADSLDMPKLKGEYLDSISFFFSDLDFELSDYAIKEEDAINLKNFVDKNSPYIDEIVVHCVYAQGRSPAVGYVLSKYFNLSFDIAQYPDINKLVIKKLEKVFFENESKA